MTEPLPVRVTVSVQFCGCESFVNVAVTFFAASISTVHAPVPVHAPDQPANTEPASATAVSVTTVPPAKFAPHAEPQKIPAGTDDTTPVPVPFRNTLSG